MTCFRAVLFLYGCFLSLLSVANPESPKADIRSAQNTVIKTIEKNFTTHTEVANKIWQWAEVGYQEKKSSKLLQTRLKKYGFKVDKGVAGMPTAFVASYGSGKPVVAFLAEFDALPGVSQSRLPTRDIIDPQSAGHACGHHLLGVGALSAAQAVKTWLQDTKRKGTVRVYGTPAEEGGSGKVYMVRDGLFDDVDVVLDWHPADRNSANMEFNLANRSAKFRFYGVSAHAAGAPHRGRSALDGVEAMNMMVNMMREHMSSKARIHYVISKGGEAPNVVPAEAEVYYYARHPDPDGLDAIWERLVAAAKGAAMGTETTMDFEVLHGNRNLLGNRPLQTLAHKNLSEFGGVEYTDKEMDFAKKLYSSLHKARRKIGSQQTILPYEEKNSYGSTDVGDVSWAAPTARVRVASWVPGTSAHSWQAVAAGGMSIGHKGMRSAAQVLAATAVNVFLDPELVAAAKKEFDKKRGENFTYKAMLGDREPPLDFRKKPGHKH